MMCTPLYAIERLFSFCHSLPLKSRKFHFYPKVPEAFSRFQALRVDRYFEGLLAFYAESADPSLKIIRSLCRGLL